MIGQLVRRGRPETDAHSDELRLPDARHHFGGGVEQFAYAADRRALVVAHFLARGADEQRAVGPRHEVAAGSPDDPARTDGSSQRSQSSWPRTGRTGRGAHARDLQLRRPASGREHDVCVRRSGPRRSRFQDRPLNPGRCAGPSCSSILFRAGPPHRPAGARARVRRRIHAPARTTRGCSRRRERARGVAPRAASSSRLSTLAGFVRRRQALQLRRFRIVERHVQGSGAFVRGRGAASRACPLQEPIVERKAARPERLERVRVDAFEVRRQHAAGGLRGPASGRPRIDDVDVQPAGGEALGNGAPDDAATDDDHIGHQ